MSKLPEADFGSSRPAEESRVPAPKGRFQELNPLERPGWDELILSHREASFFHTAGWASVLQDTYGHTPHYFGVLEGERLSALLPLMEVNSLWTGRRGVSLPFTDECPCLSDGSIAGREIFQEAIGLGRKRKWKYFEWSGIKGLSETNPPSVSFFGHVLSVSDREEEIFARFDSRVRGPIRKAERAKVQVEISQSFDSLLTFYSLHCKTRRKHGLPPQSLSFFRSIFRHVLSKGMGFVIVANYQDKPIAAAVFFHFNGKAIYKFSASDSAFQHLCGNNLILWEAIKWYSARGYASLHFGRTSIANEGLRRFKLGFGTDEYKINFFKYDLGRESFVPDRDRAFGWFNGVFRLMPIPLLRLIGKLLYRHLSCLGIGLDTWINLEAWVNL